MDALELTVPFHELVLRGVAIYVLVMIVIRVMPKRSIGNNSPGDMLALIIVGALVADAMSVGSEEPVDYLILAATVALMDWLVNLFEYRFPWFARITAEAPTVIVRDGRLIRRAMRSELITEEELMSCVRRVGLDSIASVRCATVETTGEISVIPESGHSGSSDEQLS